MRIRKRHSQVPLSDPYSPPMVQLNPPLIHSDEDDTAAYFNAPSLSDHLIHPIQLRTITHTANLLGHKDENEGETSNASRSAKMDTLSLVTHELSNSLHQAGKWCEGEKAFPMKKKRGNSEKTKTKGIQQNGKKRGRGGGLLEGSRCSRVNGRGWRCCQQTLVGYSLCEHHLGKGRLRSMRSVGSQSKATSFAHPPLFSPDDKEAKAEQCSEEGDEKNIRVMLKKTKKTKLGIVKARSMSSLLGQQDEI